MIDLTHAHINFREQVVGIRFEVQASDGTVLARGRHIVPLTIDVDVALKAFLSSGGILEEIEAIEKVVTPEKVTSALHALRDARDEARAQTAAAEAKAAEAEVLSADIARKKEVLEETNQALSTLEDRLKRLEEIVPGVVEALLQEKLQKKSGEPEVQPEEPEEEQGEEQ